MDHIFGDSHDITFGGSSRGQKGVQSKPHQSTHQKPHTKPSTRATFSPQKDTTFQKRKDDSRTAQDAIPSLGEEPALTRLVSSMKPSFLPREDNSSIVRMVVLSDGTHHDPLTLLSRDDETILIGSGFGSTHRAGRDYTTFPDMRLLFSEKEHISAWILTDETLDVIPFLSILPSLGFPPIYATRGIITKFREQAGDATFLEKCRFFELFAGGISDRRIGTFDLVLVESRGSSILSVRTTGVQIGFDFVSLIGPTDRSTHGPLTLQKQGGAFLLGDMTVSVGDIVLLRGNHVEKHALKFTFDTFYIDGNSIGVVAGYTLGDREQLAENGVLTFTLEEDSRARTIAGHIFIDSRGFVHAYEMMSVHKEILKGIRATYEKLILENQRIERGELVQSLRREITKYCYVLTGRTPVVMPIVIER